MSQLAIVSIVDDDASVRNALDGILRSKNLLAYSFASAREFLDSPRLYDTSCIIADVQMPEMNGLELQRILKARSINIPIIFVTAHPDERVRRQALSAGAFAFFDKPFDGSKLIACINEAIGRKD